MKSHEMLVCQLHSIHCNAMFVKAYFEKNDLNRFMLKLRRVHWAAQTLQHQTYQRKYLKKYENECSCDKTKLTDELRMCLTMK